MIPVADKPITQLPIIPTAVLVKHRVSLDRLAGQLLERETLTRDELFELLGTIEPESRASETVGTVRAVEN